VIDREARLARLQALGESVLQDLKQETFPVVEIPDRGTGNIVFDENSNQYILGTSRVERTAGNYRHIRSFTQLIWVASYAKSLIENSRTSSLRDLYYSSEAFGVEFSDQAESDRVIADLESLVRLSREEMGIYPEENSSVYGEVTMRYSVPGYEGREVDLTISPDGLPIGPALMSSDPVESNAEIILAVESGGMFSRLIETRSWERFNALLVHLGGQAPRSTRRLLRRIHDSLSLPVYIFTDGDPWGMHIAKVITSGSANSAHISDLTVHDAKWIGVTADDIEDYQLPTEPMTDYDLKRLDELANDVRYRDKPSQSQIRRFKELKLKAEQQAFSRHGMDYVVETYLPDKLE
jgi:DNA topoisomerase-6 subunit A